MTDAAELVEAHGLAFEAHEVAENPYMPQESSDLRHWLCTLSGGPVEGFEFYLSAGDEACPHGPDAAFALSLVIEDVRAFRECGGYSDFARLIGIEDDDPSGAVAWNEAARLAPLVESLLESAPTREAGLA